MELAWMRLVLAIAVAAAATCTSPPGYAEDQTTAFVRQCPEAKAQLDVAFATNPDFDSIGDVADKRLAQCEYFKDLTSAVGKGFDEAQQCRARGAVGIDGKQVELRRILSSIRSAASRFCAS